MKDEMKHKPLKWAVYLLEKLCDPRYLEEVHGDLLEDFYKRVNTQGHRAAQFMFVMDVVASVSLKALITQKSFYPSKNLVDMLSNNFHVVRRKLILRRSFAFINVIGLATGFAGALTIYLYLMHAFSFDRFHAKADQIYRVYCSYASPGESTREFPETPAIFATSIDQDIEGIERVARLFSFSRPVVIQHDNKVFNETEVFRVDDGFFDIFSAHFLAGNPAKSLVQPRSLVLTRSIAVKYFGAIDLALNQPLVVDAYGKETFKVTGVVEDFPSNSHLQFNVLLSIDKSQENYNPENWLSHDPVTYVLISEEADARQVETGIRRLTEKILNPLYLQRFGKSYDENKQQGGLQEYRLQPLTDIHLYSPNMGGEGNIIYIYVFIVIGALLICIASFNYINLSTARSAGEAKSVGIRKVLGATNPQLQNLFLSESVVVCLIAAVVAVILVHIFLTFGNQLVSQFTPVNELTFKTCLLVFVVAMLVGILSGFVPARLIGTFDPTKVLKGQLARGTSGSRLRQVLVVSQFVVSMGLVMATLLIGQQLDYIRNKALGFDKENLLVIKNIDKLGERKLTLKQALSGESFVVSSSLCYNLIGEPHNSAAFTPVELIDQGRQDLVIGIPVYIGDQDYLKTLDVDLLAGHLFPENLTWENKQIILNKEALRAVGWQHREANDVIGKVIDVNGLRYELAGIVEDYNFRSLHQEIGPMAIFSHYYQGYDMLMLRIKEGVHAQTIKRMQEHWQQLAPDIPFDYSFLDEDLERLYTAEKRMNVLFRSFAGLAIFIACLGLLGLVMFSVERRVQEIGIRKVLGASVRNIIFLLSQDIVKLIILSFVVASPLAWYIISKWLENFAYKIEISIYTFLLAGGLTLLLALLTIVFQSVRAALVNPVESLRYE